MGFWFRYRFLGESDVRTEWGEKPLSEGALYVRRIRSVAIQKFPQMEWMIGHPIARLDFRSSDSQTRQVFPIIFEMSMANITQNVV